MITRNFRFVANRLILTLAGRHPGDRDETLEGLLESTTNRLADLGRLQGFNASVTVAARDLTRMLDGLVTDASTSPAAAPADTLSEPRRLLEIFDQISADQLL